jgi:hypothetical protein
MPQLDNYEVDEVFGCWLFGNLDRDGYPIVWRSKTPVKAYLLTYEAERGPIPKDMTLEHRCRRRACVRPSHLLVVSMAENLFRRKWSTRVRRDICEMKHDRIHSMVTPEAGILCRICDK